ncbi:uncharacterized protein F4822DRAFT_63133 [Hypoxylon trugodes]|uniref:uncharacterized protein n=1 Tax=Hypoxylon trugodes TaxID=326681 RepID=UPI0021927BCE|nr:uncharacterized protein F4822DRAFT_63133 [Hypoxylon trugodes]KAI1384191.1 hypothetical protein F4822DRAFT_63133 [Hypoxylon trugodes]
MRYRELLPLASRSQYFLYVSYLLSRSYPMQVYGRTNVALQLTIPAHGPGTSVTQLLGFGDLCERGSSPLRPKSWYLECVALHFLCKSRPYLVQTDKSTTSHFVPFFKNHVWVTTKVHEGNAGASAISIISNGYLLRETSSCMMPMLSNATVHMHGRNTPLVSLKKKVFLCLTSLFKKGNRGVTALCTISVVRDRKILTRCSPATSRLLGCCCPS